MECLYDLHLHYDLDLDLGVRRMHYRSSNSSLTFGQQSGVRLRPLPPLYTKSCCHGWIQRSSIQRNMMSRSNSNKRLY